MLVSQLHVVIQTLWSQCLCPRRCVNKSMDCSLSTGLPVQTWSASTFSSASLSCSKRLTNTGTQLENKFFHWCFRSQVRNVFDFLNTRTGLLLWQNRSPCSNNWIFGLWLGLLGVFTTSCNFWTHFFHPIVFNKKSLEEVKVTQKLSRISFRQIPSW